MKILVVDDHPLIQEALQHVLAALDPKLELIQAQDASEAHAALSREPDTDLIVLDLALPGSDGFELLGDLRREWPGMPVLVLSATHDRATVERKPRTPEYCWRRSNSSCRAGNTFPLNPSARVALFGRTR